MYNSAGILKQHCTAHNNMTELQKHLLSNQRHKAVYFNEKGEWLFFPHPSFPIVKSRNEVLEPEEKEPEEKKVKKVK